MVVHDWLYSYVYQDGLWVWAQLSRLTEPLWDTLSFPFSAHAIFSRPKGPFDFHLPHSTQPSGQKESPSYDLTYVLLMILPSFLSCPQLHLLHRYGGGVVGMMVEEVVVWYVSSPQPSKEHTYSNFQLPRIFPHCIICTVSLRSKYDYIPLLKAASKAQ